MQNPFWNSAGARFVNKDEIIDLARTTARRIADRHPEVVRILLFGSLARGDYGSRSDLDLLIILRESNQPAPERIGRFLDYAPVYPTDMLVYTEEEVRARISAGDAFLARALKESMQVWPEDSLNGALSPNSASFQANRD
jgi:predicted nucleotidyltransferase